MQVTWGLSCARALRLAPSLHSLVHAVELQHARIWQAPGQDCRLQVSADMRQAEYLPKL